MGKEKRGRKKEKSEINPIEKTDKEIQKIIANNYNARVYSYFLDIVKTEDFSKLAKRYKRIKLSQNTMQFRAELMTLCNTFGLDPYKWIDIIDEYLKSGKLPEANDNFSLPVTVFDTKKIGYVDKDTFPVMLAISPFASQRDIVDYIKNFHKDHILPIQERSRSIYKNTPLKTRSKDSSTRKRNDFIYENRELPRKKIMSLVTDSFGETLDYGHIGKIISEEKKKRENK